MYNIHPFSAKINLFVRALETGRKASICGAFLICFAESTNQFYIYRWLCLSCNVKRPKTTTKLSEISWNKRRSNQFQWYPMCIHAYADAVSRKSYILVSDRL